MARHTVLSRRAEDEADARQEASEKLEALQALVAKAAADIGLAGGPAAGDVHATPEPSHCSASLLQQYNVCASVDMDTLTASRFLRLAEHTQNFARRPAELAVCQDRIYVAQRFNYS